MSGLFDSLLRRRRDPAEAPLAALEQNGHATALVVPEDEELEDQEATVNGHEVNGHGAGEVTSELTVVPAPAAEPEDALEAEDPDSEVAEESLPAWRLLRRARIRRRVRYLRSLREVQLRDLGGFLLELHRFDRERADLVAAKLRSAAETDAELRALARALGDPSPAQEVREPGIGGACLVCGAVHGSQDHFCATCGAPLSRRGRRSAAAADGSSVDDAPAPAE